MAAAGDFGRPRIQRLLQAQVPGTLAVEMPEIILSTLNAKYIHTAFGLRYLLANLGELQSRACLLEFDINQRPIDIAEILLAREPKIIGLGIYIWNVAPTTEVVAAIKRIRPEVTIILGGPETSYEWEGQRIVELADHVITGEADLKFAELCQALLSGNGALPPKIVSSELPDFSRIALPYDLYTDQDVAHRIIYLEASRGCPFTCEFCLSSLDIPVRQAPLPSFLEQLQRLIDRGVKQFKFVDRTFNLNLDVSRTILEFFLTRYQPGQFFHFEMVPDRLPEALRQIIVRFPPGALQFEVGIQTFNEEVGTRIKRRQNYQRLEDNLRFLRNRTGVHIHADLIAGLPGETLESFAAGFDRLVGLAPQEIQVGLLKRLRGTPLARHDEDWGMVYNAHPPYEVLQTSVIDFSTMQKLRRFARFWDLVGNSGNFVDTAPLIWNGPKKNAISTGSSVELVEAADRAALQAPRHRPGDSPFWSFLRWSEWLHVQVGRSDGIALARLMELLFDYLRLDLELDPRGIASRMWGDYQRGGRRDPPPFLKEFLGEESAPVLGQTGKGALPRRQRRHLGLAPRAKSGTLPG